MHKQVKLLTLILFALLPIFAVASEYKIVAVVNGEAISNIQLNQRVDIIINSSGMDNNLSNRKRVTKEALEILINETLQKQEAAKFGIELTDNEVNESITDLEKKNKIPEDGFRNFIEQKGLSYEATLEQVKAGLLWQKTLSRIVRPDLNITDQEIRSEAAKFSKSDIRRLANISEIVVPVEYEGRQETIELVRTIKNSIEAGTKEFSEMAKKYSVGKTAEKGGKVGWIKQESIIDPLKKAVLNTREGEISEPIEVDAMYVLLKVNDKKVINPAKNEKLLRQRATVTKMEKAAKRYIKELRQKAYIERKYPDGKLYEFVN